LAEVVNIDELLASARQRIQRVTPEETKSAMDDGALVIDIRPVHQRVADGEIPGARVIDRNVLEWRLDEVEHDRPVIVVCNEGYASSLAASTLVDLGYHRAGDLDGGVQAWIQAGLPVQRRSV
jgi:rhodanese-related sulfurtransferase